MSDPPSPGPTDGRRAAPVPASAPPYAASSGWLLLLLLPDASGWACDRWIAARASAKLSEGSVMVVVGGLDGAAVADVLIDGRRLLGKSQKPNFYRGRRGSRV